MGHAQIIKLDDFTSVDGDIDWCAYRKAQVANGEECTLCGACIPRPHGHPTKCSSCEEIKGKEELGHETFVRCPKCGDYWDPTHSEDYDLFEDGEHGVSCQDCGCDFTVSTSVSYWFTSPSLLESTEEGEADV